MHATTNLKKNTMTLLRFRKIATLCASYILIYMRAMYYHKYISRLWLEKNICKLCTTLLYLTIYDKNILHFSVSYVIISFNSAVPYASVTVSLSTQVMSGIFIWHLLYLRTLPYTRYLLCGMWPSKNTVFNATFFSVRQVSRADKLEVHTSLRIAFYRSNFKYLRNCS
jgi:hypothetical protein